MAANWQPELDAIKEKRDRALQLGGAERIDRQHAAGKLTVRERIDYLLDDGTFLELGMLATQGSTRTTMEGRYTAADGLVVGYGRINGREVMVAGEDFTVMGGSEGQIGGRKRERILELAITRKIPMIWLLDGVGARTGESLRGSWVGGRFFLTMAQLSGQIPQVGIAMGPCAGGPALMAPLMDFLVMVEGQSMLAAGGPPIVESATGEKVTKEELGGSKIHTRISGVADNEAADEHAAMDLVRDYLSYFPSSAWLSPPVSETVLPPEEGDILDVIPRSPARPYDMRKVLRRIVDGDSMLEIKPAYGSSMITTLARLGGHPVGILANQPMVRAGIIDAAAADKATHFIQLCDAFHIPLLFFADVPGVMTGTKAEQEGTLRRGLRMAHVLGHVTVPMVSVVVRKAFGMGGVAMAGSGMGQVLTLAWPTAQFGTMPMRGAVQAAHRREIEAGTKTLEELTAEYETYNDIFGPAESYQVDDIVDPGETRGRIIRALEATRQDPRPKAYKHGIMP